jgi:hypothetical protein
LQKYHYFKSFGKMSSEWVNETKNKIKKQKHGAFCEVSVILLYVFTLDIFIPSFFFTDDRNGSLLQMYSQSEKNTKLAQKLHVFSLVILYTNTLVFQMFK